MTPLYAQIGGREAVAATVDLFYERVLDDPLLAPYFAGRDVRRLKAHMRAFLAAALGGPDIYAGRDMRAAHAHLHITGEAFDAVAGHLVWTLAALGVEERHIETIVATVAPLRDQIVAQDLDVAA